METDPTYPPWSFRLSTVLHTLCYPLVRFTEKLTLECICLIKASAYLPLHVHLVNTVNKNDAMQNTHSVQIPLESIIIQGRRVNTAVEQDHKCILLYFPRECLLLVHLLGSNRKKNAFATSTAAYHVPVVMLTCSKKILHLKQ